VFTFDSNILNKNNYEGCYFFHISLAVLVITLPQYLLFL
jgi:hypothetical protein